MPGGRPIQKRTARTYKRDIEALNRLRMAILMDRHLPAELSVPAVGQIDTLVSSLIKLASVSEPETDSA